MRGAYGEQALRPTKTDIGKHSIAIGLELIEREDDSVGLEALEPVDRLTGDATCAHMVQRQPCQPGIPESIGELASLGQHHDLILGQLPFIDPFSS
jgi:hypothetical protein